METALTTFLEVQAKGQAVKYRVIHAQECIQVTLRRDDREIPLDPTFKPTNGNEVVTIRCTDYSRSGTCSVHWRVHLNPFPLP